MITLTGTMNQDLRRTGLISAGLHAAILVGLLLTLQPPVAPPSDDTAVTMEFATAPGETQRAQTQAPMPSPSPADVPTPDLPSLEPPKPAPTEMPAPPPPPPLPPPPSPQAVAGAVAADPAAAGAGACRDRAADSRACSVAGGRSAVAGAAGAATAGPDADPGQADAADRPRGAEARCASARRPAGPGAPDTDAAHHQHDQPAESDQEHG